MLIHTENRLWVRSLNNMSKTALKWQPKYWFSNNRRIRSNQWTTPCIFNSNKKWKLKSKFNIGIRTRIIHWTNSETEILNALPSRPCTWHMKGNWCEIYLERVKLNPTWTYIELFFVIRKMLYKRHIKNILFSMQ